MIDRFTNLPPSQNPEKIPAEVEKRIMAGEFLGKGEFNQAVYYLSQSNLSYRSAYLLVKVVNSEPKQFMDELKAELIKKFSGAVLGIYDPSTFSIFLPKVNSLSLLKTKMRNFYTQFTPARINKRRNEITVAQIKIGATIFPYSTRRTFEQDASFALNKTKDFSIYLPKTRPINLSRHETIENINRQFLLNAETMLSEMKGFKDFEAFEKFLSSNLLKLSGQFGFHNAGYLLLDHSLEEYSVRFEESRQHEHLTFRKILKMKVSDLSPIFDLTDETGSLYGGENDSYPIELNAILNNLDIKSFYFQSINDREKNLGLLYFCSSDASRPLTVNEQTIISFVGAFIGSFIKQTFQSERENRTLKLLEHVVKMDEQYVYIVDKNTNSLLYWSDNLSQYYYSLKTIGEKCYKVFFNRETICETCPLISKVREISLPNISPLLLERYLLNYAGNSEEATIAITTPKNPISATEPVYLDRELSIKNKLRFELDLHTAVASGRSGYVFTIALINPTMTPNLKADETTIQILEKVFFALIMAGFGNISYRVNIGTFSVPFPNATRMAALNLLEDIYRRVRLAVGDDQQSPHFWMTLSQYPRDVRNIADFDEFVATGKKNTLKAGNDMVYMADTKKTRNAERQKYILELFQEAVEKDKIEHFIQPIVNLSDGRAIGGEILLRLYDNNRGYIPPFEFLPLASGKKLMFEIEKSLLNSIGELWKTSGFELFRAIGFQRFGINISHDSITNHEFLIAIKQTFGRYRLPKKFIQLEISENLLADYQEDVAKFIKDLAGVDVVIALDNFTNRAVDFDLVATLGFTCVKIDGDLVRGIENDSEMFLNFARLVNRINEKNVEIIVQGIETDSQADLLRNLEIKLVQGFFFAKPMAVADFIKYLDSGK